MKRSFTIPFLIISLFAAMSIYSCKEEEPIVKKPIEEEPKDTTKYTTGTKPIFDTNCALSGCHQSGASIGSLANYNDAKAFAGFGRLLGAIKHESGFSKMPKNQPKLSDVNIAIIEKWIAEGLHE